MKTLKRTELHTIDAYWKQYDATLAKIREVKPQTLEALKVILEGFSPSQGGEAFFPSGSADDGLDDALYDAGWMIGYIESTYLWNARTRAGAQIHYVEGDIYAGEWVAP